MIAGAFVVLFTLLNFQPVSAEVQLDVSTSAGIEFDDYKKTVYLVVREKSGGETRVRISPRGRVREFLEWRGEPFILNYKGEIFGLDLSRIRSVRERLRISLAHSSFATAYCLGGIEAFKLFHGGHPSTLEQLTWDIAFTVASLTPLVYVGSSYFSLASACNSLNYWSLGLFRGTNFFKRPIAVNVMLVDRDGDDYHIRFMDGSVVPLSAVLKRGSRFAKCEKWLTRVSTSPVDRVRKVFGF